MMMTILVMECAIQDPFSVVQDESTPIGMKLTTEYWNSHRTKMGKNRRVTFSRIKGQKEAGRAAA